MDILLVPRQPPDMMLELLKTHLARRGFDDVEVTVLGKLEVAKTHVDSPLVGASAEVWRDMGEPTVVITPMTGGSGPLSLVTKGLGIPAVMAGGGGVSRPPGPRPHQVTRPE